MINILITKIFIIGLNKKSSIKSSILISIFSKEMDYLDFDYELIKIIRSLSKRLII